MTRNRLFARRVSVWILFFTCGQVLFPQAEIRISGDLSVRKIAENIWLHISYTDLEASGRVAANGLCVVKGGEAFLIDTPWNDQEALCLYQWVETSLQAVIKQVIVTHTHADCMGGLQALHRKGVSSVAGAITTAKAKAEGLPVPQQSFEVKLLLRLAGQEVFCYYPGPAHTVDNIVVWLPAAKILFGGCLIKASKNQTPGNVAEADLVAWPQTLQNIKQQFPAAKIVIPGHGEYGGPELIDHTLAVLQQKPPSR